MYNTYKNIGGNMKKNYYLPMFMCFGLALGIAVGQVLLDNIAMGMTIGLIFGVAVGIGLDSTNKEKEVKPKSKTKKKK
jgi:hypothetical protein